MIFPLNAIRVGDVVDGETVIGVIKDYGSQAVVDWDEDVSELIELIFDNGVTLQGSPWAEVNVDAIMVDDHGSAILKAASNA